MREINLTEMERKELIVILQKQIKEIETEIGRLDILKSILKKVKQATYKSNPWDNEIGIS